MILKILRYDDSMSHLYIDKVNHIDLWKPRVYDKTGKSEGNSERVGRSIFVVDCEVKGNRYYMSDCYNDDGDYFLLGFDTYLTVMNDDGKVIQKIVANTADKRRSKENE